jgi:hypothetical protein
VIVGDDFGSLLVLDFALSSPAALAIDESVRGHVRPPRLLPGFSGARVSALTGALVSCEMYSQDSLCSAHRLLSMHVARRQPPRSRSQCGASPVWANSLRTRRHPLSSEGTFQPLCERISIRDQSPLASRHLLWAQSLARRLFLGLTCPALNRRRSGGLTTSRVRKRYGCDGPRCSRVGRLRDCLDVVVSAPSLLPPSLRR